MPLWITRRRMCMGASLYLGRDFISFNMVRQRNAGLRFECCVVKASSGKSNAAHSSPLPTMAGLHPSLPTKSQIDGKTCPYALPFLPISFPSRAFTLDTHPSSFDLYLILCHTSSALGSDQPSCLCSYRIDDHRHVSSLRLPSASLHSPR